MEVGGRGQDWRREVIWLRWRTFRLPWWLDGDECVAWNGMRRIEEERGNKKSETLRVCFGNEHASKDMSTKQLFLCPIHV